MNTLDLSKPSLAALSHVLRHPEIWPEGFSWSYSSCLNCAMGLAHNLWRIVAKRYNSPEECVEQVRLAFTLPRETAYEIFLWAGREDDFDDFGDVTPTDIADLIDAYLVKQAQERVRDAAAAVMTDALEGARAHSRANLTPHDPFRVAIEACDAVLDRIAETQPVLEAMRAMTLADIAAADDLLARLKAEGGA